MRAMKILKRLVGGVVLLVVLMVAALFLARFRPGANVVNVSVDVNASPDALWELISRPELVKKWVPELVETKSETPGKTGVGARDRCVMAMDGERTELVLEVTKLEPPRRLEMDEWPVGSGEGMFRAHITYALEPIAGGTRLTESSLTDYRTYVLKLLEPIISRSAANMLHKDLQTLKALAEKKP